MPFPSRPRRGHTPRRKQMTNCREHPSTHRTLVAALTLATLALLAAPGISQAAAIVERFASQESFSEPRDDTGSCLGAGATGTMSGTDTVAAQVTLSYPNGPFHLHGTDNVDYRVDYVDGRYLIGTAVVHFDIINNPLAPRITETDVHRDRVTLYGPDGQPLGPVTIFGVFHTTFADTNGNLEPDPGEITADVANVRFTCP